MTGLPYLGRLSFDLRAPKIPVPGMDLAGVIEAVGHDVTRFQPGDEVFGIGIGAGAYAQYARVPETKLIPPQGWTWSARWTLTASSTHP